MRYNEPQQEDHYIFERVLTNLDYLWKVANLSYTPKIHSILVHALDQMKSKGNNIKVPKNKSNNIVS